MKATFVFVEFLDGSIEGVVFTSATDAQMATTGVSGNSFNGSSTLAGEWWDLYGVDGDLEIKTKEIEI